MNDTYMKAKELFEKELDKIVTKDSITPTELELSYKLIDILKDISEICEKDDGYMDDRSGGMKYSMRASRYNPYMGNGEYMINGSYGRGGYNGRYGSYDGRNSRNSSMNAKLQQLYDEAGTDHERMMIQSLMNEMMN